MFRNFAFCILGLVAPLTAMAQAKDPRVDALTAEVSQLKRTLADQDQRITQLEKAVKALQAMANPAPERIPAPTPAWQSASNWNQIKPGMSAEQVIQILGPPVLDNTVTDTRTLSYQPSPNSTTTLRGTVTLMDDRVIAMVPPAF